MGTGDVPDAPFKGNEWTKLGLKQALDDAIQRGDDYVMIAAPELVSRTQGMPLEKAQKFYGEIVPNLANEMLKPYGVKLEQMPLPGLASRKKGDPAYITAALTGKPVTDMDNMVYGFKIPDAMKQQVKTRGFPLLSVAPGALGAGMLATDDPENRDPTRTALAMALLGGSLVGGMAISRGTKGVKGMKGKAPAQAAPQAAAAGKRIGSDIYVQPSAIDSGTAKLRPNELEAFTKAKQIAGNVDHDMVNISGDKVRLLKMSSLSEPHPVVSQSIIVDTKTGAVSQGKTAGQIYHRMETMLDPSHPSYEGYKAMTEYQESIGALGPFTVGGKTASGHVGTWQKQLASKGLDYDQVMAESKRILDQSLDPFGGSFVSDAGKTARNWKTTAVYQTSTPLVKPGMKVVDYGSGPYQNVRGAVEDAGGIYVPFDRQGNIGNINDIRDADLVMASNVLNVQTKAANPKAAYETVLKELHGAVKSDGTLVVNMPSSGPKESWMTPQRLADDLGKYFSEVTRKGEVIIARKPKAAASQRGSTLPAALAGLLGYNVAKQFGTPRQEESL
jgi:hypothetical protein